ncbi:MAG: RNA-dependent DNA polymerase [Gammaproteobacteria bacterium]|nr:RNA-dependent DNA polymerase [Gammaproteobacteria bacterium]
MKTYRNLYPRLCEFENLYRAYRKARRGKRSRPEVAAFESNLEPELVRMQHRLTTETFRPGPYRNFQIYEGKPRRISAAPFRDRVVHHALCNIIEPIWERRFIHDSYACRKGKGTHAALDRCSEFLRSYRYVLQCDIVQFFPSIDYEILYHLLDRFIADSRVMRLIRLIIDSGQGIHDAAYRMQWFPGDDLLSICRPRGLPIGNQTSQFWSNVYLHQLDEFVKRELKCRAYLRYCDDFLLFADDKATLHRWRDAIEDHLIRLRLVIHGQRTSVHPVERGTPFLGFLLFPSHRRLARSNALRFRRRFSADIRRLAIGRVPRKKVDERVCSWIAHAAHGDTWGLRRAILSSISLPIGARKKDG